MGKTANGEFAIDTLGDLIDYGKGLWLHCDPPGCGRTLRCDVYDLAEQFGRDTIFVAKRWPVRCMKCGGRNISMIVTAETRQDWLVKRDGPDNMRASRTPEEREKALAMIGPEYRAKFGLPPLR